MSNRDWLIATTECVVCANDSYPGNKTVVAELARWPNDFELALFAVEATCPEVTFFCRNATSGYTVRWFNRSREVPFCGHGALALANLLGAELEQRVELLANVNYPILLGSGCVKFPVAEFETRSCEVVEQGLEWVTERDVIRRFFSIEALETAIPGDGAKRLTFIGYYLDQSYDLYFKLFTTIDSIELDPISISALPVLLGHVKRFEKCEPKTFTQIGHGIYKYNATILHGELTVCGEFTRGLTQVAPA